MRTGTGLDPAPANKRRAAGRPKSPYAISALYVKLYVETAYATMVVYRGYAIEVSGFEASFRPIFANSSFGSPLTSLKSGMIT